jgi:hypothetical protein
MSENITKKFAETLQSGQIINSKIWNDNSFMYLTYILPAQDFEAFSEQKLIKLVSALPSFDNVPAEYTRQAGISEEENEIGTPVIELTFVLGNKE